MCFSVHIRPLSPHQTLTQGRAVSLPQKAESGAGTLDLGPKGQLWPSYISYLMFAQLYISYQHVRLSSFHIKIQTSELLSKI